MKLFDGIKNVSKTVNDNLYAVELQKRPEGSLRKQEKAYLTAHAALKTKIESSTFNSVFPKVVRAAVVLWFAYMMYQHDGTTLLGQNDESDFWHVVSVAFVKAAVLFAVVVIAHFVFETMRIKSLVEEFNKNHPTPEFTVTNETIAVQQVAPAPLGRVATEGSAQPQYAAVQTMDSPDSSVTDQIAQSVRALGGTASGRIADVTANIVSVAGSGMKYLVYVLLETADGKPLATQESMDFRSLVRGTVDHASRRAGAELQIQSQVEFKFSKA